MSNIVLRFSRSSTLGPIRMRKVTLLWLVCLGACAKPSEAEIPFTAEEDAPGSYRLITYVEHPRGVITFVTQRNGPSGIAFSRRRVDCARGTLLYLGGGSTYAEAATDRTKGTTATFVRGTSAHVAAKLVCQLYGTPLHG